MTTEYPWHELERGNRHTQFRLMMQHRSDGHWGPPRKWGYIMKARSPRCRSAGELCSKHPWLWTASRTDKVLQVGTTLEDILPSAWRNRGLPYIRWWIEGVAPLHDRWAQLDAARESNGQDFDGA